MYPNDHLPAHIHVYEGEKVARVRFDLPSLGIMDSNGFRQRELDRLCAILLPYRPQLIAHWNRIHPDFAISDELN